MHGECVSSIRREGKRSQERRERSEYERDESISTSRTLDDFHNTWPKGGMLIGRQRSKERKAQRDEQARHVRCGQDQMNATKGELGIGKQQAMGNWAIDDNNNDQMQDKC